MVISSPDNLPLCTHSKTTSTIANAREQEQLWRLYNCLTISLIFKGSSIKHSENVVKEYKILFTGLLPGAEVANAVTSWSQVVSLEFVGLILTHRLHLAR